MILSPRSIRQVLEISAVNGLLSILLTGSLCAADCDSPLAAQAVPSAIMTDPLIQRAVQLKAFDDFKLLMDRVRRPYVHGALSAHLQIQRQAQKIGVQEGEVAKIRFLVEQLYESKSELLPVSDPLTMPRFTLSNNSPHKGAFDYIEATWQKLIRQTPLRKESTLIPLPNPILIPGARFQEAYYWDSYFAMHALIRTGREKFVRGQIDNFLFLINKYGLVPNGNRDYYLSRSQPPLLSRMVRLYLHEKKDGLNSDDRAWLRNHVLPTLKRDYFGFWMNSGTRLHAATGLNHHWDAQNEPRPERHAADIEEQLGATYRDVRAEAESGRDFTAAYEGEATQTATVFLNALMYGLENDLAWFSELAGDTVGAFGFRAAMQKRKRAIQQHLYDPETDFYYHYNLREKRRLPYVTAEVFALVYFGVLTPAEGRPLVQKAMARLQATGGVMGSTIQSGKQWDAPFGWAPDNMIAIEALRLVGDQRGARHLARNWVSMVDRVFGRMGTVLEKYDMIRADAPEEAGDKYVTQQGFLWSNGVYVWILTDILKQSLVPL